MCHAIYTGAPIGWGLGLAPIVAGLAAVGAGLSLVDTPSLPLLASLVEGAT